MKWCKPIVIHSRNAYAKTFEVMKQILQMNHPIHLHCFLGTMDDVQLFTSYFTNIKFGFTPLITRGNVMHAVLQQLHLTQILSETDSPYFVPEEVTSLDSISKRFIGISFQLSRHSRTGHPGMVYSVVETIGQLRRISVVEVARQLKENAYSIYGI